MLTILVSRMVQGQDKEHISTLFMKERDGGELPDGHYAFSIIPSIMLSRKQHGS